MLSLPDDKTIIACAITGSVHTPTMSPHLPITPGELIDEGVAAAEAGASIIHVHVRDPENGRPIADLDLFREVVGGIIDRTDAIVQPTTGGAPDQSNDERFAVIPALEPEMASFNVGSMNLSLHKVAEAIDEFDYEWEREYLESTLGNVADNSFATLYEAGELFDEHGTKPELECYDVGHLYSVKHLADEGAIHPPFRLQFVMGLLGGISAEEDHLVHLINTAERLFGDDAAWSVIGAGRQQFQMGSLALTSGGHVRVGMEDNLYLSRGELATSNAEQVEKIVEMAWDIAGRDPATAEEVREVFSLRGQDAVQV